MTSDNKDSFSATEVGALVESLRSEFSFVSERVVGLCEDMDEVKDRLTKVETRLTGVEDAVRLTMPRLSSIESKLGI